MWDLLTPSGKLAECSKLHFTSSSRYAGKTEMGAYIQKWFCHNFFVDTCFMNCVKTTFELVPAGQIKKSRSITCRNSVRIIAKREQSAYLKTWWRDHNVQIITLEHRTVAFSQTWQHESRRLSFKTPFHSFFTGTSTLTDNQLNLMAQMISFV